MGLRIMKLLVRFEVWNRKTSVLGITALKSMDSYM